MVYGVVSSRAGESTETNFFLRAWKTADGLPDNAVTSIVQTHDGYLWLATYGGLARFDGVRFAVFNSANTPALQSDRITSLYEDARNTLWIAHERGDLTCYRDGKFEAQGVHEHGERRKISYMGADENGDIWMLNEEGTLLRTRDGATCALPNTDAFDLLAEAKPGKIWISSGGQLAWLQQGILTTNHSPHDGFVQGICASHDGNLWVICNDRIRKWDGAQWIEERGTNPCPSSVSGMLETAAGALVMGTVNSGVYILFPNQTVVHFDQKNGLPYDWVRCVEEDREGTLWLGVGSGGLVAIQPAKVLTLNPPDHLEGNVALSVTAATDGAVWVGTEGAGLYRYLNGYWSQYGRDAGFSNVFIWSASQDQQGRLWAGTWGSGVYVKDGEHFMNPPGLTNISIPTPAVFHARDGTTWIGTSSGLIHYQKGVTQRYGESDGLKVPDVRAIAEDAAGGIWFGTLGSGLARLQDGQLKLFSKADGLASDYIQCLHFDREGTLWVGTYGNGLCRYQAGRFTTITTDNGLPNNFICDVQEDDYGNFWISSHKGIVRVTRPELAKCANGEIVHMHCMSYGLAEGMPSMECSGGLQPASAKTADGRLWFPTSRGVVVIDPKDVSGVRMPPPVVLEDIVANGKALAQNPDDIHVLKFSAGAGQFEFHYTGLSFQAPEKILFQHQLVGWDPDWIDAGTKRTAEYNYLPPASYTFRVRARNDDGFWIGDGISFKFQVLPHFWQTWWFRLISVLAGAGAVGASVLFATRQRMRRKVERIQRQQSLERERTRIAKDIHDHLGANLTRISLLSQSAHGELDNPAQAATQLDRIYNTTRELTRSLDEIVWAVNPQHDTLDSLANYLGNFAQEFLVPINIRCRLDLPLQLPHWPITAEVRHNVFLAFKETLNNIAKHSAATEVTVLLAADTHDFTITVRDNGCGFDLPQVEANSEKQRLARGNGLKNMRQRLEKLGGHATIDTAPGHGTRVTFFVQVQHN
jgi:ligand-binding sensor domain-containing protein/signal transduction histidine kinase